MFLMSLYFPKNGNFEHILCTINNMVRTLPFHAHLPPMYLVEALYMEVHLLNILPSTTMQNDTPFHKLFNKQPFYSHLWGLVVYVILTLNCLTISNQKPFHVFPLVIHLKTMVSAALILILKNSLFLAMLLLMK